MRKIKTEKMERETRERRKRKSHENVFFSEQLSIAFSHFFGAFTRHDRGEGRGTSGLRWKGDL